MEVDKLNASGVRAVFVGDVFLSGTGGPLPDQEVQAFLLSHDIRCCNFEGAAYHPDAVTNKKAGPAILQGSEAAERVLESGFNLISIANNHAMDYGMGGMRATITALSGATVVGGGETAALAHRPYITEINGVKLGFLALTEKQYGTLDDDDGPGCAWIMAPGVRNTIRRLRAECSQVVVICHAGLEDVDQPLPQWRNLYRRFIDAGASAVIAHHPHVPQGYERYKQGLIFYSLGNAAWEPETDFLSQRSIAVSLTLPREGVPAFSVAYLTYKEGKLQFCREEGFLCHMAEMNRVLNDPPAYERATEGICRTFYETVAVPDFYTVTGALPGGWWQRLKNAAKLILRKPALNEPLLYSMLDNESYRWAVCGHLKHDIRPPKESTRP